MPAQYLNSKPDCYRTDADVARGTDDCLDKPVAEASPAEPLTAAQHAVAAAFGYSAEAAPDILRVGCGAQHDEETPSRVHLDITTAFEVEPESRV